MQTEGRVEIDLPDGVAKRRWGQLAVDFHQWVSEPASTRLVVTQRFEEVVNRYLPLTPWEYGDEGSTLYMAGKADGARAAGKTITLAGGQSVVVVSAALLNEGEATVQRVLAHEAQHVRLHEQDTAAWAVHRRQPGKPIRAPRPWEFVWAAQTALDEYRVERAVRAKLKPAPATNPDDVTLIVRQLREARAAWVGSRDLNLAYQLVVQAVDRLGVVAAYTAAAVRSDQDDLNRWAGIALIGRVWGRLDRGSTLGENAGKDQLWERSLEVAEAMDLTLQQRGIRLIFENDSVALYFTAS